MTTKKYLIAVDVTTTAPLHITAIEKGSYDPKKPAPQRLARFDGPGIGTSLTRTQALAMQARVSENGVYVPLVPVIPASTVGGKLRRAAGGLMAKSLVARGLKISPDAYNVLMSGMASTELKADEKIPEVLTAARRDPFLSVFGGTSFALSAHSVISEGWPNLSITESMLMGGSISEPQPFEKLGDMTDVFAIVRKNDVADMRDAVLADVVGVETLSQYIETQGAMRADSKAKKAAKEEGKKTDLRALNGVEAVRAGVSFALRVEVTAFEPSHLGLMLLATQEFLREGQVGGKAARGFGRFNATNSVLFEIDPDTRTSKRLAAIYQGKETGYAFQENAAIDKAVEAAQDYLDSLSPAVLEAFTHADAKTLKKMVKEVA